MFLNRFLFSLSFLTPGKNPSPYKRSPRWWVLLFFVAFTACSFEGDNAKPEASGEPVPRAILEAGRPYGTFSRPVEMTKSDWVNAQELARTFFAAPVRIPQRNRRTLVGTMLEILQRQRPIEGGPYPTVIYLHGCAGLSYAAATRMKFLADAGFAVIAPNSLARLKYPRSCNPYTNRSGMYRGTLYIRLQDAAYAIKEAAGLPWVDANNIILMGLSEGGLAAALHKTDSRYPLRARIVEGWTCQAGWTDYRGMNAPPNEPVLTLTAKYDPWYYQRSTEGSCEKFLHPSNGSRSIVYTSDRLSRTHGSLDFRSERQRLLRWLANFVTP